MARAREFVSGFVEEMKEDFALAIFDLNAYAAELEGIIRGAEQ